MPPLPLRPLPPCHLPVATPVLPVLNRAIIALNLKQPEVNWVDQKKLAQRCSLGRLVFHIAS
jgi:hypothetical protein